MVKFGDEIEVVPPDRRREVLIDSQSMRLRSAPQLDHAHMELF